MPLSLKSDLLAVSLNPGDCEPIGHRSPLPRIETSTVWPDRGNQSVGDMLANAHRLSEGERIWRLVQEAAGGTVTSVEAPEAPLEPLPAWPDMDGLCGFVADGD